MGCLKIFLPFYPSLSKKKVGEVRTRGFFDLQRFAGEKTEEATPKRKAEAREKGQVAKSMEINSVFVIVAAFFTLKTSGAYIYDQLAGYMKYTFTHLFLPDLTITTIQQIFIGFGIIFVKTAFPVMFVIVIVALGINFAQVGFNFTMKPLMPDFNKVNPLSGFGRLFSKRSIVELFKSLFKIAVIGTVMYRFMVNNTQQVPGLISAELIDTVHLTASLILDLVFNICMVLFIMAVFDYMYQWWENQESMKMSKDDIKQEYKQMEGDPQLKGKIKERQRAMSRQRMMQEVPQADVVVTNPTHFAVALKYDQDMLAPIIVAKGKDLIAQKIKEIAKEHKVIILENKMLARTLYASVEIGHPVPHELYQAVAEVLAYVYKLKKRLL